MKRKQLRERVAYLQGLAKGLRTDKGGREAEILVEVLDVMGSVVHGIDRLRSQQQELGEYLDAVDQDLADLEEDIENSVQIFGEPGGTVVAKAGTTSVEAATQPGPGRFVATDCPNCGQTVYFDEDYLDDDQLEITCPDCGEMVWDTDEEYEISDIDEAPGETSGTKPRRAHVVDSDDPVRESWQE